MVPGTCLHVSFDPAARLDVEEQRAICQMATRQIESRLPVGVWAEVRVDDGVDA
jgi:hypothetical protein